MTSIHVRDWQVLDVRFPTSDALDGSDAMHASPDYSAAYVVLRRRDDRLALVDLPAAAIRGRKGPSPVERNHYEYLSLGRDDDLEFSFFSPGDGQATVSLRARRRSQAPRISSRLTVNGVEFPINEGETPRDDYAEVTRTVPVRAARAVAATACGSARFAAGGFQIVLRKKS